MRIIEVRDGFVKFEADEIINLSSFIQLDDRNKSYIAQVIQTKPTGLGSIAYARILFQYDGSFQPFKNTNFTKDVQISSFSFEDFSKSLYSNNPIAIGNFINENIIIPIDRECFNNKTLVSIDNTKNNNILLSNLVKQFNTNSKVVIIDMLGAVEGEKFIAGVDFKLPLNTSSLSFIYEDCLNDATADSKALIKEIFTDLSEYSKTVDFLPFGALKTIIDEMVEKSHIFKLLVLKNKLAKFEQLGYFAATKNEAENLKKILSSNKVVFDLSKLDAVFQNRYLMTIYSLLQTQSETTQVFVEASNCISKKSLKLILTNDLVPSVLITHSRFNYLNEIKSMFENYVIEPSFTNNEVFKKYIKFLASMEKDSFLVVGAGTNYLPLVSKFEELELITEDLTNNEKEEEILSEEADVSVDITEEDLNEITEEIQNSEIDSETAAIDKKSEDLIEKISEEVEEQEPITAETLFSEDEDEEISENIEENNHDDETVENDNDEIFDEIVEEVVSQEENENIQDEQKEIEEDIIEIEANVIEETEDSSAEDIEVTEEDNSNEIVVQEEISEVETIEEYHTHIEEYQTIEIPADISDLAEEAEMEENSSVIDDEINEANAEKIISIIEEEDNDAISQTNEVIQPDDNKIEVLEVLPINEEFEEVAEFDEIVELDENDLNNADIIVDIDEVDGEVLDPEALDREIVEDVDKVFTTMKEDTISDSDLDFIDELNNEPIEPEDETQYEELSTEGSIEELTDISEDLEEDDTVILTPIEELNDLTEEDTEDREILETRNSSTPMVPVYNADIPSEDTVISDAIEQGDTVIHAKHGVGVVEKMIKYGTKTLFSINFDNVGRRLLDPTLTEIKKA